MSAAEIGLAPSRSIDPTLRGVLAMLAAMACFVCNDTLVKLTATHLPASEIMVVRGVIGVALVLAAIRATGAHRNLRAILNPLVVLRSLVEAATSLSFITALSGLALAEATTLMQATPLIIAALSVVVLRERVGWRGWLAVAVGFVGVVLVAQPSPAGLKMEMWLVLLAAALVAVRDLMTRRIPSAAPSLVVTLAATLAVLFVGAGIGAAAPGPWVAPSVADLVRLTAAAVILATGNMAIVTAFRGGDIGVIGPFRYSVILWAMLLGALVWGDFPAAPALAGAVLIAGSGLYALRQGANGRPTA
jgi:drug/metabolite transporter (DMT)-like permease